MKRPGPYKYLACISVGIIGLVSNLSAESTPPGWDQLVELYYKAEVINYCSLADAQVIAGFQNKNSALLEKYSFTTTQLNEIRGEAWAAGHAEWDNRGLGGFRGWCRQEGIQYRDFFLKH